MLQSRKPFQFGLRDIAWAILVVAVSLGWWSDHQSHGRAFNNWVRYEEHMQKKIDELTVEIRSLKSNRQSSE